MKIQVKTRVETNIFEEPEAKKRIEEVFKKMSSKIRKRISTVLKFIELESEEISCDIIQEEFKESFCRVTLAMAVKVAAEGQNDYNILKNYILLLSEERLTEAIKGKMMIDVISAVIRNLPNDSSIDRATRNKKILMMEKKYL